MPVGQVIRVRAISGPDAFQSAAGALDGNRDGVPGDDFIGTFQLGGTDVIARFASFISPSGGAVGDSLGLPIDFSSVGGVRSLRFTVDFDPEVLEITRVVQAPGLPRADVDVAVTLLGDGRSRLTVEMRFAAPLVPGSVRLAYLEARTPSAAAYGSQRLLSTAVTAINGTALLQPLATGAVQVVAVGNDANRDTRVNGVDQALIDQIGSRIGSGFDAWRLIDPNLLILAGAAPTPPVTPVNPTPPTGTPTGTPTLPVGGGGNPAASSSTLTTAAATPATPTTTLIPGIVTVTASAPSSAPLPPVVGEGSAIVSPAVLSPSRWSRTDHRGPGRLRPMSGARRSPASSRCATFRPSPTTSGPGWPVPAWTVPSSDPRLLPAPRPRPIASASILPR